MSAILMSVARRILDRARSFLREEDGMGTVEIILIIVVLIGLVIVFKTQIGGIVQNVFQTINSETSSVTG